MMRLALILTLIILKLHVAEGVEGPLKEVPASEILNKIENGLPVEYDHVIILNDLNINNLKGLPTKHIGGIDYGKIHSGYHGPHDYYETWLTSFWVNDLVDVKTVISPIRITDSMIVGIASFNNTIFENTIDFSGTTFNAHVNFLGSNFNRTADFWGSNFEYTADFEDTTFNNTTSFWRSTFKDTADFRESTFNVIADFRDSTFNSNADFSFSSFYNDTDFYYSKFNNTADFSHSNFNNYAGFSYSRFNISAGFHDTNFKDTADFRESTFNGIASFWGSNFNSTADFSNSNFNSDADFRGAQFSGDADFRGAQFSGDADFEDSTFNSDADFSNSRFNEGLHFKGIDFNNLIFNWFSIKDHSRFISDRSGYIALVKHFKNIEDFESADDCYYHYRNWRLRSGDQSWAKSFVDSIFMVSCGYGVKPMNTIILSAALILLFGLFYWRIRIIRKQGSQIVSYRDAIFYSASIFFTLHPASNWSYNERWRYVIIFEDILGWILMTLFVITMGHVMLR